MDLKVGELTGKSLELIILTYYSNISKGKINYLGIVKNNKIG